MGLKESELWSKVDSLTDKITDLQKQKTKVLQEIAESTCPFKVGQTLIGSRGLAGTGVVVHEIVPPAYPSKTNRWEITTFALTKSGEVSKRVVSFSEWGAEDNELKVKS